MSTPPPPPTFSGHVEQDDDPLIFRWRDRPWRAGRLAVVLLFSLLAHAAAFYLLQVAYTPTGSLQPPSAQVVLLAPETPAERAALEQWLKMADPALMTSAPPSTTQEVLDKIDFRYVPSYAAAPPAFKSLEPASTELNPTPERSRRPGPVFAPPGAFLPPGDDMPPSKGNAAAATPTRLIFRGPVASLAPAALPPWQFTASQKGRVLEPTVYLVGVRPGGGEPWLFRQPSTGETTISDATLDEAARVYLAQLTFANRTGEDADARVVWGWATFYWGREIYR